MPWRVPTPTKITNMADLSRTIQLLLQFENTAANQGISESAAALDGLKSSLDFGYAGAEALKNIADSALAAQSAVVALAGALLNEAFEASDKFQNKQNEISTLFKASKEDYDDLSAKVLNYGITSTQSFETIQGSLYNAISAGVDYKNSTEFLSKAEELAVAGRGNLADVTGLLAGSMNAYGISSADAVKYIKAVGDNSDTLFTAIQKGILTLPDLTAGLGQILSKASAAGVSFDELVASVAAVTSASVAPAQAITAIGALLDSIIAPSSQASKTAADLGVNLSVSGVQADGFAGFMKKLGEATGGSVEKVAELIPASTAIPAALSLAKDSSGAFAGALEAMTVKAGAASGAFETLKYNSDNLDQILANSVKGIFIAAGNSLGADESNFVKSIAKLSFELAKAFDAGPLDGFADRIQNVYDKITAVINGIAENIGPALAEVDFSPLLESLDEQGKSLSDVFGSLFEGIDLTTESGLTDFLNGIVKTLARLGEVVSGIIDSYKGTATAANEFFKLLSQGDDKTLQQIGNLLGYAKQLVDLTENFGKGAAAANAFFNAFGDDRTTIGASVKVIGELAYGLGDIFQGLVTTVGYNIALVKNAILHLFTPDIPILGAADSAIAKLFGIDDIKKAQEESDKEVAILKDMANQDFSSLISHIANIGDTMTRNSEATQTLLDQFKELKKSDEGGVFGDFDVKATAEIAEAAKATGELSSAFDELSFGKDEYAESIQKVADSIVKVKDATSEAGEKAKDASPKITDLGSGYRKIEDSLGNLAYQYDKSAGAAAKYEVQLKEVQTVNEKTGEVTTKWVQTVVETQAAHEKLAESADKVAKKEKDASDAAAKLNEKLLELQNRKDIAILENFAKIDIARIEADTEKVKAAFDSIDNTVKTTGNTIGDLFGTLTKATDEWDKSRIRESIDKQETRQQEALDEQKKLIDAQTDYIKERTQKLQRGDSIITVQADGLKEHLEKIFGEIIREATVKASEEGLDMLLGYKVE